jgi:hypothetical protein
MRSLLAAEHGAAAGVGAMMSRTPGLGRRSPPLRLARREIPGILAQQETAASRASLWLVRGLPNRVRWSMVLQLRRPPCRSHRSMRGDLVRQRELASGWKLFTMSERLRVRPTAR